MPNDSPPSSPPSARVVRWVERVTKTKPEPKLRCARCNVDKECRDLLGDGQWICFGCSETSEREAYVKRVFFIR